MKELDSFTVERLEELIKSASLEPCDAEPIYDNVQVREIAALARIALAAKRAEPNELADAVNEFLAVLDNYPEQLVPINRNSVPVKDLRKALSSDPQLNSPEIPEDWISIPRDMLADYRDVKNAEVENYKAGFAGYYNREGTRWARDFADLCEELAAIDKVLAAAPEKDNG
ncbi:Uncharacterised protein [Yersinia intermedia]|nr:Uncharacterised protein [Yersinia intermedia]